MVSDEALRRSVVVGLDDRVVLRQFGEKGLEVGSAQREARFETRVIRHVVDGEREYGEREATRTAEEPLHTARLVEAERLGQYEEVRRDPATTVDRTATVGLECGATLDVPLFIKEGDTLRVDTRTGEYSERVSG